MKATVPNQSWVSTPPCRPLHFLVGPRSGDPCHFSHSHLLVLRDVPPTLTYIKLTIFLFFISIYLFIWFVPGVPYYPPVFLLNYLSFLHAAIGMLHSTRVGEYFFSHFLFIYLLYFKDKGDDSLNHQLSTERFCH